MSTLCHMCNNNSAVYSCPRCNIPYCSVACYRNTKHVDCSESFYKDQILATLASQSENDEPEGRKRMEEILMRLQDDDPRVLEGLDSDDEEEETENFDEDLSERLAGVSLDDADAVWQCLTTSERAGFEKLLQSGKITELLPKYSPWWEKNTKLVEEVPSQPKESNPNGNNSNESQKDLEDTITFIPVVVKNVPCFKSLCKKPPSPCLLFNTANLIGAYVCTVRLFNGEHQEWPSHAAYIAWNLSSTLNNNDNFHSMLDAITSISVNMSQKENASEEDLSAMKADAQCILSNPQHIPASLSDLLTLFRAAVKHRPQTAKGPFSQRFPDGADNLLPREKLKLSVKKLEFYLSWVLQEHESVSSKQKTSDSSLSF